MCVSLTPALLMPAQVALLHKVGGGRLGWQQMFLPAVSVFLERPRSDSA